MLSVDCELFFCSVEDYFLLFFEANRLHVNHIDLHVRSTTYMMVTNEYVVNDALGIAQFITKSLEKAEAIQFLSSIATLTSED